MAVLRSGILGRASGKVAGVVGGHWKDRSYIREYVIPSNPNTTAQQSQRAKMRAAVAFVKQAVGPVLNVYVDRFQKSMSGFNSWIAANINHVVNPDNHTLIKMTFGKLWHPDSFNAVAIAQTIVCTWTANSYGSNGLATDKVFGAARSRTSGLWYFAPAEVARSTGTLSIACPAGESGANVDVYVWAARYSALSPTLLDMVSDSQSDVTTLA